MSPFVYNGSKLDPFDLELLHDRFMQEALFIFGIFVAGKGAVVAWPKTKTFLEEVVEYNLGGARIATPFEYCDHLQLVGELDSTLLRIKVGQYQRIGPALKACGKLSRQPWHFRALQEVPGVGLKTAKLVELYSVAFGVPDRGGRCACLDIHVLRDMKTWPTVKRLGVKVPHAAPQDRLLYEVLEVIFLHEADRRDMTPWQLDKQLWKKSARHLKEVG